MQQPELYRSSSTCNLPISYDPYVKPVGQIVEIGERAEVVFRFCTGFNILQGQYFFTAGHCMSSDGVCHVYDPQHPMSRNRCVVNFGYEMCRTGLQDTRIQGIEYLHDGYYSRILGKVDQGQCTSMNLDYGVLKLSPESAQFGSLEFSNELVVPNKTGVLLVHHPEGYPKQYGVGQVTRHDNQFLVHSAHTKGGSSGAPVISTQSGGVVGVHVSGDGTTQQHNSAVMVSQIVQDAYRENKKWVTPYLRQFGIYHQPAPRRGSTVILDNRVTHNNGNCCQ